MVTRPRLLFTLPLVPPCFARTGSSFTLYNCHVSLPIGAHNQHSGNDSSGNGSSTLPTSVPAPVGYHVVAGTRATILCGTYLSVDQDAKVRLISINTASNDSSFVGSVHGTVSEARGQYGMLVIRLCGIVGGLSAGIEPEGKGSGSSPRRMLITDEYRTQDLH